MLYPPFFVARKWMQFYVTAVGEGLAPPAFESPPDFVRETSNQSRRSVSLLLWEKGDHEVVDEELVKIQDTSSVSLRLPPSPTGEGLGYARRNDAAYHSLHGIGCDLRILRRGRRPRRPAETIRHIVRGTGDTRPKVGGIAHATVKIKIYTLFKGFCGVLGGLFSKSPPNVPPRPLIPPQNFVNPLANLPNLCYTFTR